MSMNYFINNQSSNPQILSFESWIVWQKLSGNSEGLGGTTTAKNNFFNEGRKVQAMLPENSQLYTDISKQLQAIRNLSFVSLILFYQICI